MGGRPGRLTSTFLGTVMGVALAAIASPSFAQSAGSCLTSTVPETFTLPDGTVHPAGRLTLCTVLTLNPVMNLHRVRVEGEGTTFILSRRGRAESTPESRPVLLFKRVDGAPLDLVGFVLPSGRTAWNYALRRIGRKASVDPATTAGVRPPGELTTPSTLTAE